jgi:hypothetical protein
MEPKKESESNSNSNQFQYLPLVIILPLIWGLIGVLEGKGFFQYIFENIKALIILCTAFLILLGILTIFSKK